MPLSRSIHIYTNVLLFLFWVSNIALYMCSTYMFPCIVVVQQLSCVQLFETPWSAIFVCLFVYTDTNIYMCVCITNTHTHTHIHTYTHTLQVSIVKAKVFPVVMYRCESRTIKKAEHQRIDTFEQWCWRRLLRVTWTVKRSNQSVLKEINPKYSLKDRC